MIGQATSRFRWNLAADEPLVMPIAAERLLGVVWCLRQLPRRYDRLAGIYVGIEFEFPLEFSIGVDTNSPFRS